MFDTLIVSTQFIYIILWYVHYYQYYSNVTHLVPFFYVILMISPYYKMVLIYRLNLALISLFISYKQPSIVYFPTYYTTTLTITCTLLRFSINDGLYWYDIIMIILGILFTLGPQMCKLTSIYYASDETC